MIFNAQDALAVTTELRLYGPLDISDSGQIMDETQIARDRGLPCKQQLDLVLDVEAALVDVVVEGDHLARQLDVLRDNGLGGAADRALDELRLDLERLLEVRELIVERGAGGAQPNLPVT